LNSSILKLKVSSGLKKKTKLEQTKFFLVDQTSHFYFTLGLGILLIPLFLIWLKKLSFKKGAFFLLLAFIPVIFHYQYVAKKNVAIVFEESQVREGPSQVFTQSHIIPRGTKVITEEIKSDWVYIVYPLSFVGWIKRSQLGVL
jgi:hypothetical protein